MGRGEVGLQLCQSSQVGYCSVKCISSHCAHAALLEQASIAGPVAAIVRAEPDQILEDGDRLIASAAALKSMRQLVRRLRSQGPRRGVEPDRLRSALRRSTFQKESQVVIEPYVAWMPPLGAAEYSHRDMLIARIGQGYGPARASSVPARFPGRPPAPVFRSGSSWALRSGCDHSSRRRSRTGSGSAARAAATRRFHALSGLGRPCGAEVPSRPGSPPGLAPPTPAGL